MIDLANPSTYGPDVDAHMTAGVEVLSSYFAAERLRDERYERGLAPVREPNTHFGALEVWRDQLADIVRDRDLLAYHYSRMTDVEVARVLRAGFQPTSLALLRERLDYQVDEGNFTEAFAETIYASSPLHFEPAYGQRVGMFWMVAPAVPVDDGGVELLVGMWGGEAAYWCLDPDGERAVRSIGRGRIFSVALPLSATEGDGAWKVANHLLGVQGRRMGFAADASRYDFCVTGPIAPKWIVRVVSEGEIDYLTEGVA